MDNVMKFFEYLILAMNKSIPETKSKKINTTNQNRNQIGKNKYR